MAKKQMSAEQMLAELSRLPCADLMGETKITDPLGAGLYYQADTVVHLIADRTKTLRMACEALLAVFDEVSEEEMARLRGRADEAIRQVELALERTPR